MKTLTSLAFAVVALGVLGGCSTGGENPPGYEKKDFEKTAPPPEYRGPGQPGAPSSGPVTPPPPSGGQAGAEPK